MLNSYKSIVKNIDLFEDLDDDILDAMLESFSLVDIKENDILFHQGDPSDALFITLSGYLLAMVKDERGELKTIGRIKTGELIGEIGFLSKKPRGLTVKALTHSKLLKLSSLEFSKLVKSAPDIVYQILLNIIIREHNKLNTMSLISQQVIKKTNRHILLLPVNNQPDLAVFFDYLKIIVLQHENIYFLDEESLLELYETKGLGGLMEHIDKLEKSNTTILYRITEKIEKLIVFILKRADVFTLVGIGNTLPEYSPFVCRTLEQKDLKDIKKELILVWPNNTEIKNTHLWLNPSDFHLHYHVFQEDISSYERLLRFFQGKAVGLVLGGGAARGWAHVGVMRALREKKIPIDAIGGTSSGSGLAGFYLVSKGNEELLIDCVKKMRDGVNHSIAWFSITLPLISFYNATRISHSLKYIFKEKNIENLEIPYFAISTNVSNQTEKVHRIGKVWRAVRASAAIPGFFPPLVENGHILYDGGLMNNLPIDRMRKLLGPNGIIIASDLEVSQDDNRQYYFPPELPISRILLSKLGFTDKKYVFPNFFSTLLKSMLLGSLQKTQNNISLADYYIHPDVSKFKMLSIEEVSERELIENGYQSALAILKEYH